MKLLTSALRDMVGIDDILLMLEPSEAKELAASLDDLSKEEIVQVHHHINDTTYQKEITACLCNNGDISPFHPIIRNLIEATIDKP